MGKSIYSLALSDEVVAQIDRAAYRAGLSRSAMVNRILAGYASCVTPEERAQGIYHRVILALQSEEERFRVQSSASALTLRTALAYKYNPTLRYSVELTAPENAGRDRCRIGELRISLRSRNEELMMLFARFFSLWNWSESMNGAGGGVWDGGGRWCRSLLLRREEQESLSEEEMAEALLSYIRLLDTALSLYFSGLESETESALNIENLYETYLKQGGLVFG